MYSTLITSVPIPLQHPPDVGPPCSIIEPLASRCSKFRFKPLDPSSTSTRLEQIASAENVPVTSDTIQTLISTSHGDLRRAITYLQSASRLAMSTTPPSEITPRDIQEIAGVVPDAVVSDFASALGIEQVGGDGMDIDMDDSGKTKAKGFDGVRKKVKEIIREGYSASQIIAQVSFFPIHSSSAHPDLGLTAARPCCAPSYSHCTSKGEVCSRLRRSRQSTLRWCRRRAMDLGGRASRAQSHVV